MYTGAVADAFTLFSMLESKLEEYPGQLTRAAVEVAKVWRKDKHLRLDVSCPRSPSFLARALSDSLSYWPLFPTHPLLHPPLCYTHLHARVQAEMVVADAETTLTITGQGEVVEPHDGIISTWPCA